jgi:hypothetical protein
MTWNMFTRGFEYAQRLGLHNIDSDKIYGGVCSFNLIPDDDRKGFWELLSRDIFFRLIFDKSPSITGNPGKVNLPWLDVNNQSTPEVTEAPEATIFFIISQITLILLRFFAMMENGQRDAADMLIKTEEMCQELMRMYEKWDMVRISLPFPIEPNIGLTNIRISRGITQSFQIHGLHQRSR